jgi:hypothetical protein
VLAVSVALVVGLIRLDPRIASPGSGADTIPA